MSGDRSHLRRHSKGIADDFENITSKGKTGNNCKRFRVVQIKLLLVEKSNNQNVAAVFMRPIGNYHAMLNAFLESKGYRVI